ncbi:MAG: 50S ribosomal protein L29 [Phormidesmis sp.]
MALSKAADLRELSDEDLTTEIAKVKRDLFDLRFKKATRQMETGFHEFKHTRRKLAQLMTIERERQLAAKAGKSTTVTAESPSEEPKEA